MSKSAAPRLERFHGDKPKRWTDLHIEQEREIGAGNFGIIYEAEAEVSFGDTRRTCTMVIKKYKPLTGTDSGVEASARSAMQHYQQAKQAGLKVFNTFRIADNQTSVLMTNGTTAEHVCVGTGGIQSKQIEDFDINRLTEMSNSEALVHSLFEECVKAAQHEIKIPCDAYFFLIQRDQTAPTVDFVLGDVDRLMKYEDRSYRDLLLYNIGQTTIAFRYFLDHNTTPKARKKYYTFFQRGRERFVASLEE